ncbi:hypothetical protein EDD17DRAFT_1074825 [Pisolithus thermaeus]|nr:hypothetical protein EDD17DRAFT_1074825 [Pisolithus thermaeus]
MTIMALAEVVITMSLCILLYDRGSGSALPRTKRLLNTLIIYTVNRCLLILLAAAGILAVVLAAQVMWFLALSLVIGKCQLAPSIAEFSGAPSVIGWRGHRGF